MNYLLIDTNAWIDLISSDPDLKLLFRLKQWISEEKVQLIVPEILLLEWNDKKALVIKRIKANRKEIAEQFAKKNSPIPYMVEAEQNEILENEKIISELLNNGIYESLSEETQLVVSNRQLKGLAPFKPNGTRATNGFRDALIFFSGIEISHKKGIKEFLFISGDSDFSDKNKLHPELEQEGLKIDFHNNIGSGLGKLIRLFDGAESTTKLETLDFGSFYNIAECNPGMHLLEQLNNVVSYLEFQQPFVPTTVLRNVNPFKVREESSATYVSGFSFFTNNEKLLSLLCTIKVDEKGAVTFDNQDFLSGVENPEQKVKNVYRWLNRNLVYYFRKFAGSEIISVSVNEESAFVGSSIEKVMGAMKFNLLLHMLNEEAGAGIQSYIEKGFIHAQLGNYCQAIQCFNLAAKDEFAKNQKLLFFTCVYNIKLLSGFCKSIYTEVPSDVKTIIAEYAGKSIENFALQCSINSPFEKECVKFLEQEQFIKEAWEEISQCVMRIKEHYLIDLNGGYSSNSFINSLFYSFAKLENYLDLNHIAYKINGDFYSIFDIYLEGLITSYAIGNRQNSKLKNFDDYLLHRILWYAEPNRLDHYLNQFNVREINYNTGFSEEWQIGTVIINLWSQHIDFLQNIEMEMEEGKFFMSRYEKIISNSFILLAFANLSKEVYLKFSELLLQCLKVKKFVLLIRRGYLSDVVQKKGHLFSNDVIRGLIDVFLDNTELHDFDLMLTLSQAMNSRQRKITLSSDIDYERVLCNFYNKMQTESKFNANLNMLGSYFLFTDELKERFITRVENDLNISFNVDVYYFFSVNGIIDYKNKIENYIDSIPACNGPLTHRVFGNSVLLKPELNNLLNLLYTYNDELDSFNLSKFKGGSLYYDWLLDLDKFDYELFDPCWILEHRTLGLLKKIFQSAKVKVKLREFIKKTGHSKIAELFVQYS